MIVFRVFRQERKFVVKLVHFVLQLVAFAIAVWGMKAVFDFHNHMKYSNLYSLHSWCGLTTVILFGCQALLSVPPSVLLPVGGMYALELLLGLWRPFLYSESISAYYQKSSYTISTFYCQMPPNKQINWLKDSV